MLTCRLKAHIPYSEKKTLELICFLIRLIYYCNYFFQIYSNGVLSPRGSSRPMYDTNSTWIAPYYRSFTGVCTIYYRETNETPLLHQVNNDIKRKLSTNFYATNLFIVTYISLGQKFQATLATDGKQTITVLNYEELPFDPAGNVEMNERGCGYRVFFRRFNSAWKLLNGNEVGVRGRHIFNLTTPGCFKITKGNTSTCSSFSCPSHLECQVTGTLMPFCGCIQNCARYNDSKEFCGSDFNNYESVCLMNKDHCQRFGNESKSNVTIHYYGKCQGMFLEVIR